jgi:hypothetical protein
MVYMCGNVLEITIEVSVYSEGGVCFCLFVTVGHKGFQLDGATVVRKNIDFSRCFACRSRMLHPRGDKYIAGHCNVAHIYTNTTC